MQSMRYNAINEIQFLDGEMVSAINRRMHLVSTGGACACEGWQMVSTRRHGGK